MSKTADTSTSTPPTVVLEAHCHCNAFQKYLPVPSSSLPLASQFCSCTICRRTTGSIFAGWLSIQGGAATFPEDEKIYGIDTNRLTAYAISERVTYYFCGTCGAHVACTWIEGSDGKIGWCLASGLIEAWNGCEPMVRKLEFLESGSSGDGGVGVWLGNGKRFPKYERWGEGETIGDEKWQESMERVITKIKDEADKDKDGVQNSVSFTCHCGGFKGHITRTRDDQEPHPRDGFFWLTGDTNSNLDNQKKKYCADFCGCDSCHHTTGQEQSSWFHIPVDNIVVAGEDGPPIQLDNLPAPVKKYESTADRVLRMFCGTCGAKLFYQSVDKAKAGSSTVGMTVGLIESKVGARAEDWFVWRPEHEMAATDMGLMEELNKGIEKWEAEKNRLVE